MPYRVVQSAPEIVHDNGVRSHPVLTLEDGCGGRFHIGVDDHCFVLYGEFEGVCAATTHWFWEAVEAIQDLAMLPDEAWRSLPDTPETHIN